LELIGRAEPNPLKTLRDGAVRQWVHHDGLSVQALAESSEIGCGCTASASHRPSIPSDRFLDARLCAEPNVVCISQ
jgi:hypothetical protein